jgi:hypothetical protein
MAPEKNRKILRRISRNGHNSCFKLNGGLNFGVMGERRISTAPLAVLIMRKGESRHDLQDECIESPAANDYGRDA